MNHYTKPNYNFRRLQALVIIISVLAMVLPLTPAKAQTPTLPEYVVVSGDTLYGIADRFKTTIEAIQEVNSMDGNTSLQPGDRLKIPGLEGLSGIMVSDFVPLGASLTVLARRGQSTVEGLIKLNKITSPSELFVGREITVTQNPETQKVSSIAPLLPGESMLEAAVQNQ